MITEQQVRAKIEGLEEKHGAIAKRLNAITESGLYMALSDEEMRLEAKIQVLNELLNEAKG